MDAIEKGFRTWLCGMWADAHKYPEEWERVYDVMYGATQTAIWLGNGEQYEMAKTLLEIAHDHRMNAINDRYKEAA